MKRLFDLFLLLLLLPLVFLPAVIVALLILMQSGFPILYWSDRVGKANQIFRMPKFRTMLLNTPAVSTDQLHNPTNYLIPMGGLIRRLSLDELPQLWSIYKGEMSFVGPRPALFNQYHLIEDRTRLQINTLLPGLTGWAQVNGRDDLTDQKKVAYDHEYLQRQSLLFDIKIIGLTILKVMKSDGVAH
ncbi:sugar transferase [Polynucleobacter sp. AM-26B4]|uniref:sugar transferase n=1 Tax=Polynucleobacter sp. AM-26B4 TaxID=2689103 RepID=UPI001C0D3089|nr:sugar transferase [Polynucleobacter sp. AM-26B4]MBU3585120.1 sugar transferase [Polynucleobacter sp. AM-26B4]